MTLKNCAFLLSAAVLAAQTAPQFEVASIRPSAPIVTNANTRVSAGVRIDGAQFRATTMALRDYISVAHGLRIYQIEAPEWMASERFDINATLPPRDDDKPLPEGDLALMMRALLDERFAMKYHRSTKEFPVYALVQTKDGIQAPEAPLEAEERSVTVAGTGSAQGTVINLGRGSSLSVGGNRVEAKKISMVATADILARFVDRPVVDQTNLGSTYDIAMELTTEDFQALMVRSAMNAGVALPPQAMRALENTTLDSLHQALAKVGLKLEARKAPLEVLIIDSANRSPSEN